MQITTELPADVKPIEGPLGQQGKHPLVAVGIGVVVGFLLARALRR